jgi:transglutaminase-like putative cysteine protease
MAVELFVWAWNRFRPREGWLPFLLIAATAGCMVAAVEEVGWVPDDQVVAIAATVGLFLGTLLARTRIPAWRAWLYLALYGLLVPTLVVGQLLPPLVVWVQGWATTSAYWRQQGALFFERSGGWLATVTAGQGSDETIIFALLLGLAAWFVAAYVAWTIFRQYQPIAGLALMGVGMAVNGYYGEAPIYWSALFVGLAVITAASTYYANMENGWQRAGIDYSTEIRAEFVLYGGAVGMALLALSWSVPATNIAEISQAFIRQPAILEAEAALSRAFAGIPQPRRDETAAPGARGNLPRSFLVGDAPELLDTIVMTATVECRAGPSRGNEGCQTALHWRAGSYDIYTGRGWSLSPEREEMVAAGQAIVDQLAEGESAERRDGGAKGNSQTPIRIPQSAVQLTQHAQWIFDDRQIRYTIGYPTRFDQPVIVSWRGPNDLSRARGIGNSPTTYEAESWIPQTTAAQLRQARLEDVPPALLARYTALPNTVPERVQVLAREVITLHTLNSTPPLPTPYDQAQAIEQFLRQYAYTLDVELPPAGADVVDYFLFDAQEGYCDYYASAMVVLARSVGLPARLATGYLAQPANELGVQTIRQINGHSWAEVYFAGYGWIEFEPTAPFASPHETAGGTARDANGLSDESGMPFTSPENATPPPIPERAPQWTLPRPIIFVLLLLAALLSWRWGRAWWRNWRARPRNLDPIEQAYLRVQESAASLGRPPEPGETPAEFSSSFLAHLEKTAVGQSDVRALQLPIRRLTDLFIAHQYARQPALPANEANELWRQVRRPLWAARLRRLFAPSDRAGLIAGHSPGGMEPPGGSYVGGR